MEIAEEECPWGEMAQNYRMLYAAAAGGSGEKAKQIMQHLWVRLFGPVDPKPVRLSDLTHE